jgi:hypothetical protein
MKHPVTMALAALLGSTLAMADPPGHAPAYGITRIPQEPSTTRARAG